jgi:uncharacterized membrane-anchored protein
MSLGMGLSITSGVLCIFLIVGWIVVINKEKVSLYNKRNLLYYLGMLFVNISTALILINKPFSSLIGLICSGIAFFFMVIHLISYIKSCRNKTGDESISKHKKIELMWCIIVFILSLTSGLIHVIDIVGLP